MLANEKERNGRGNRKFNLKWLGYGSHGDPKDNAFRTFSLSPSYGKWQDHITVQFARTSWLEKRRAHASLLGFAVMALLTPSVLAQTTDERIDLYFNDWHASSARVTHGTLEERDVLLRGNPLEPASKGAVLQLVNSFTYASLPPGSKPAVGKPSGQQEILYIASGEGAISAGESPIPLRKGVAVLVPSNLSYTITNGGALPLGMYVVNEPVRQAFHPNTKLTVKDENLLPITTTSDHWDRIVKKIFSPEDGLSTLGEFSTVVLDSLTITQPDLVRQGGFEEVWTQIDGTSIAFLGSRLHRQTPGVAFLTPPDGKTPTSSLNYSESQQAKLLHFKSVAANKATSGN